MDYSLHSLIDHTFLKPDSTRSRIEELCSEAIEYKVFSVCVPPYFVQQAVRILEDFPVKVSTVIGFPYGYQATQVKIEEIKKAVEESVDEVDVVANIAAIKSGDWSFVMNDLDSVIRLAHMRNLTVKWIIEMNALNSAEIEQVCQIAVKKEVDFVKTGTGTYGEAVTPEDITLLRKLLPSSIKIKASGGIRTSDQAHSLVNAGAERIGTSNTKSILSR